VLLVGFITLLQSADNLLLADQIVTVLFIVLLHLDESRLKHVTVTLEFHDVGLLLISLLFKPVEITIQIVHVALSFFLFLDSLELFIT